MGRFAYHFSVLGMILLLGVSMSWAQQGQSQQQTSTGQQTGQKPGSQSASSPQSPAQPLAQGQTGQQQPPTPAGEEQVSAPPLTGAEQYTLGRMGTGRSYVVPLFQFGQSVNTSGTGAFGTATVDPVTTLSGLFAFHHVWSRYDFSAQYAGSGFIYDQNSSLNSSAHQFFFTQTINGRRSNFMLSDAVSYLPQSSFGYARLPGFNDFGGGGYGFGGLYGGTGNFDTTFLPGQSLLTGPTTQVGNSVIGEYNYQTSPLTSLTFTGSYALLRFPDSNSLLESNAGIFRIGYNHTFTRKSSMGLSYQGGIFRYGSTEGNFTNHVVTVLYRRTLSERLGLQLGAGPQINVFTYTPTGQNSDVTWQASGLLNYQLKRSSLGLSYMHYTSSGSGVYYGAQTDDLGLYFATALSRMWSMNADAGYAHNKSLQNNVGNTYNSWYGNVNFNRNLNRSMSIFFSYNLQQQLSSEPTCIAGTCGTFYTEQYFSVGMNWHPTVAGFE
jgi:hypothetical protein